MASILRAQKRESPTSMYSTVAALTLAALFAAASATWIGWHAASAAIAFTNIQSEGAWNGFDGHAPDA